ncbi:MAG: hypothetical protein DRJ45_01670 [Thermoprotei archaeon]|nr:MAG: hypothetical protein DRJ45_01670 [Thermoprotei archaeon]
MYLYKLKIYILLILSLFILNILVFQASWLYPGMYAIHRTYSRILYIDGRYLNIKNRVYDQRILDLKNDRAIVEVYSNAISLLDTNVVELHGGMLGNLKLIIVSLIILFGWISIKYIFLRRGERYEVT